MATAQGLTTNFLVSRPTDTFLDAVEIIPAPSPGEFTGTECQNDLAHTFSITPFYTHKPELRFGLVIAQADEGYGHPKPDDDPAIRAIRALAFKDNMTNLPVQSEFWWTVSQAIQITLASPSCAAYRVSLKPLVTDPRDCLPMVESDSDNKAPRTTVHMRSRCTKYGVRCVYIQTDGPQEADIDQVMTEGKEEARIDGMSDYRFGSHSGKHFMDLLVSEDSSQKLREEHAARIKTATKMRLWKRLGVRVDVSVYTDTDWPEIVTQEHFDARLV